MTPLARPSRSAIARRLFIVSASIFLALSCAAQTQSQTDLAAASQLAKEAGDKGQSQSSGPGFSIETEMLTYSSMQSESRTIACEMARFRNLAGQDCKPTTTSPDQPTGIVILTSDSTLFADFQLWSAEMATIANLESAAAHDCPGASPEMLTTGSAGLGLSLTPAGQALGLMQALLASNEETSAVRGNVGDQALASAIARQLRSYQISVLVPDLYMPFSLAEIDTKGSPFLQGVGELYGDSRTCREQASASGRDASAHARSQITGDAIDSFLAAVLGGQPAPQKQQQSAPAGSDSGQPPSANPGEPGAAPRPAPPAKPDQPPAPGRQNSPGASSPLISILRGDGLARALRGPGASASPAIRNPLFQHVLWIKALESGGSVSKSGNALFGTKLHFSGGSVVTYALFNLNGELECSGTLYDFSGPLRPNGVKDVLRSGYIPGLANTLGACTPTP